MQILDLKLKMLKNLRSTNFSSIDSNTIMKISILCYNRVPDMIKDTLKTGKNKLTYPQLTKQNLRNTKRENQRKKLFLKIFKIRLRNLNLSSLSHKIQQLKLVFLLRMLEQLNSNLKEMV
jgi:hypothetical protein